MTWLDVRQNCRCTTDHWDEEYLRLAGDTTVRLDERIRVKSNKVKRLLTLLSEMASNLLDNVERGFKSGEAKS